MTGTPAAGATRTRSGLVVSAGDTLRGALPIGGRERLQTGAPVPTSRASRALRRPAGYVAAAVGALVAGAPQIVGALEGWLR
ncbi:hypothetical protein [Kineosporia sp. A_224]|uniref:hypothetical protein n=1 Tax=Kineosporia sp. A_224 TaxID=1962180 RepID=UPI00117BA456|nr:hypothetical protein [Kineosporia sp. A_224]